MRQDRDDRAQVRRAQLRDLDRGEPAVADAPHPDGAVAPRLRREPLDRVVPVARLPSLYSSSATPPERCRSRGRRPGTARSRGGRSTRRGAMSAFRRQLSLPYGIISRIAGNAGVRGSPGGHGRQMLADSSTPSRAVIRASQTVATSWRGGLAGRAVSGRRVATAGVYGPATSRRCTTRAARRCTSDRRPVSGPWTVMRAGSSTRTRGSRSGTTRSPGRTAARASTASSTSRTSRPGVLVLDDADRSLLVGQHRYTLDAYSWEIPEGGVPAARARSTGPGASSARRPASRPASGARSAGSHLSNSVTDELAALCLATGLPRGRRHRSRPRTSRSAGCRSTRRSR